MRMVREIKAVADGLAVAVVARDVDSQGLAKRYDLLTPRGSNQIIFDGAVTEETLLVVLLDRLRGRYFTDSSEDVLQAIKHVESARRHLDADTKAKSAQLNLEGISR